MDEGIHFLVVYTRHEERKFSVTARKQDARLAEVNDRMKGKGFETVALATDLAKDVASRFKTSVTEAYENAGYQKVEREALS